MRPASSASNAAVLAWRSTNLLTGFSGTDRRAAVLCRRGDLTMCGADVSNLANLSPILAEKAPLVAAIIFFAERPKTRITRRFKLFCAFALENLFLMTRRTRRRIAFQ